MVLRSILVALLLAPVGVVAPTVAAAQEVEAPPPSGWVAPVEVVLNDDGAWSWFQDERAILDGCDLIVGSVPAGEGVGGAARQGNVELSTVDLGSMSVRRDVLDPRIDGNDHAAPAVIKMPDGGLVGAWSRHSKDRLTRFGQRRADGLMWEQRGHVTRGALVTYSNLHLLTGEGQSGRLYQLFRAEGGDANILASDDGGGSWSDLGRLFTTRAGSRPYVKYVDDGVGRLHFIATNGHPREEPGGTSVYHGYIEGGLLHQSDGTPLAPIGAPLTPADFTPIAHGDPQLRYWLADIELDASGHPVAVLTRTDTATGYSHSYVHARFDGSSWQVGELAYAGSSLYDAERYYTGLAAVDPASTNRVVVSTDVDPATGDPLVSSADGQQHWELFEATTADDWVSWSWQALTTNSTFDNLRPIIPRGAADGRIMVWFRGSYSSFSVYSTEVVAWAEGTWSPETCPARERVAVERAYSPLTGDFDGDGRGDIFWYGPGSAADMVSYAAPERSFGSSAVNVSGSYVPVSGDFDGDGFDDVLWYAAGGSKDYVWWGGTDRGFSSSRVTVNGSYVPVSGDFDGDGFDDVLWYAAGRSKDYVWWGSGTGAFASTHTSVLGSYNPAVGDFDANGIDDVLWAGRSSPRSYIWSGTAGRKPSSSQIQAPATAAIPLVDDFDGDGAGDVFWYQPGSAPESRWWGSGTGLISG